MTTLPTSCGTLADLLTLRAGASPDRVAYTFLKDGENASGSYTYRQLDDRARRVAAALLALTTAGARVVIIAPSSLEWLAGFFGCAHAGMAAVPVPQVRPGKVDSLLRVIEDCNASVVAVDPAAAAFLRDEPGLRGVALLVLDDALLETPAASVVLPVVVPSSIALLQYTSGSTGNPKGVIVTHENILANEAMIQRSFGHDSDSTFVGWLPLFHDMGLIGNVLQPLYIGAHAVLMAPTSFLERPIRWLRAISRYRAHTSGGPDFAYGLSALRAKPAQLAELDLSCWKVAFNGAEPVKAQTLAGFAKVFASCGFRAEAFFPCYGLAEATLFVAGADLGRAPTVLDVDAEVFEAEGRFQAAAAAGRKQRLVGCGKPADGLLVLVVDEHGEPVADGRVGEIQISGPNVTQGYWGGLAKEKFRDGMGSWSSKRFYRTGDLGSFSGGELYILGRLDDLIIIRGRNYYPQDLETTASRAHPRLKP